MKNYGLQFYFKNRCSKQSVSLIELWARKSFLYESANLIKESFEKKKEISNYKLIKTILNWLNQYHAIYIYHNLST